MKHFGQFLNQSLVVNFIFKLLIRGKQVGWKVPKQWRVGHVVCYLIGAGRCVSVGLFFTTLSRGWAGELCPLLDNTGNTKNCGVFQHWRSAKVWPAQSIIVSSMSSINLAFSTCNNAMQCSWFVQTSRCSMFSARTPWLSVLCLELCNRRPSFCTYAQKHISLLLGNVALTAWES